MFTMPSESKLSDTFEAEIYVFLPIFFFVYIQFQDDLRFYHDY
jgi:hypothetical protein